MINHRSTSASVLADAEQCEDGEHDDLRAHEHGKHEQHDDKESESNRPRRRADCLAGGSNETRPCPWVTCRFHLARIEAQRDGRVRVGARLLARDACESDVDIALDHELSRLERIGETCALDVADRGDHSLAEVGQLVDATTERARQLSSPRLIHPRGLRVLREFLGER
jgi:hypothetical protein